MLPGGVRRRRRDLPRQPEHFAVELVVAGIGSMVTTRLIEDDLECLRGLRAPISELVHRALRSLRGTV
jgi:hypothetical protein